MKLAWDTARCGVHRVSPYGASDFLYGQKVTKEPPGGRSGWALRAHIRVPLDPIYEGHPPERLYVISGAQNQECLPAVPSGPTGALSG